MFGWKLCIIWGCVKACKLTCMHCMSCNSETVLPLTGSGIMTSKHALTKLPVAVLFSATWNLIDNKMTRLFWTFPLGSY